MLKEEKGRTVDIPLRDWVQIAKYSLSKDNYTEFAVRVALELTNHLCRITSAQFSSPNGSANGTEFRPSSPPFDVTKANGEQHFLCPLVKIEDITSANVVVSVAHDVTDAMGSNLLATGVHIKLGHSNLSDAHDDHPLTQREVCFELGRILLEIFSRGDPSFLFHLIESGPVEDNNNNDDDLFSGFLLGDLDLNSESETSQQASKKHSTRSTTNARSATKFAKAKVFLEEQELPLSICRLISDLLQAEKGNRFVSKTALLSLDEAQSDLMQMRTQPSRFLHDNTCPQKALELTSLFGRSNGTLHGRDKEMSILMDRAARVYLHTPPPSGISTIEGPQRIQQVDNFLCEVVFLSGYGGCGKTSILKQLASFFYENNWFVLRCEFDRQVAPLSMLLRSVDTFLSRFVVQEAVQMEPQIQCAFDRISSCIISSVDKESFVQLCDLLPSFGRLFPMTCNYFKKTQNGTIDNPSFEISDPSSISHLSGGVGSGSNRFKYLFQLILKAICSGGYPVSYIFEDLQWSDSISMDVIRDIIHPDGYSLTFPPKEDFSNRGLLLVGSFRKNELDEGFLTEKLQSTGQTSNINFSTIYIDELPEQETNKMLSYELCLPMRYTQGLGQIVHQKSRGNPLYISEFLRSIIHNKMVSYSVKDRRWIWDEITIDLQMISEGVVELLTRKLQQLPHNVIEALKVVSCIGQINVATIELLDLGQFVPDMFKALKSAVQEGIIDRAGPIFAFTHDLLQESTLSLIPEYERKQLRKQIGKSLVQCPGVESNAGLCILAVDQINMCKDTDDMLDPAEQALFAQLNLSAGKHSIAAASYDQARGYFEAGISLLHSNPWDKQYSLCLELFELSAVVSFMGGNVETVAERLDSILCNAKSFDDSLNSRLLRTKFLASQGQYVEAAEEVFGVLSNLGEECLGEISSSHLMSEINATKTLLKDTSKESILNLPPMTDIQKLTTMKFMGTFVSIGIFSTPMLSALYCCRIMKLTLEFGFCEETISAITYVSFALFHYGGDTELATRLIRIAESLISGHPNEHTLLAQSNLFICAVTALVEPFHALPQRLLKGYNSAQVVGDVDSAVTLSLNSCVAFTYSIPDLVSAQRDVTYFCHQHSKHRRQPMLHSFMCLSNICTALMGCTVDTGKKMKQNEELFQIAEKTKSSYMLHHVLIGQMYIDCYFRNYTRVVDYGEKNRTTRTNIGERRVLDAYGVFFEGISALCLARSTKDRKWCEIGEQSIRTMTMLVEHSEWNFRNKLHLLNAELHYLESQYSLAENSFKAAIVSAHEHRFYHEEALACELYGIFLLDTKNIVAGVEQLRLAIDKYEQWGAKKKSDDVQNLISSTLGQCMLTW